MFGIDFVVMVLPIILTVTAWGSFFCTLLSTGKLQFHVHTITVYFLASLCTYFFLISGWFKSFAQAPNLVLLGSYVILVVGSFVAFHRLSQHRHSIVRSILASLFLGALVFSVAIISYMVLFFIYLFTGVLDFLNPDNSKW
jgi:hypothetical protein